MSSMPFYYDLLAKFLVGCGGAAAILYSRIGGELPGMRKSIEIQTQEQRIEELQDSAKKLADDLETCRRDLLSKKIQPQDLQALETSYNNQRDDINEEIRDAKNKVDKLKHERYFSGAIFFVVLGGFFAALLTVGAILKGDLLDVQVTIAAVAVGTGWTGILAQLEQKGAEPIAIAERNKRMSEVEENYEKAIKGYVTKIEEYEAAIDKYKEAVEEFKKRETALKDALSGLVP